MKNGAKITFYHYLQWDFNGFYLFFLALLQGLSKTPRLFQRWTHSAVPGGTDNWVSYGLSKMGRLQLVAILQGN